MEPGDMYVGREFVTIEKCPKHETCSAQAWKRAAVWGWDREECDERLLAHLEKSSLHAGDFSEAWTAQMEVTIFEGHLVKTVTEADMAIANSPKQVASAKRKAESSTHSHDDRAAVDEAATKILERLDAMRATPRQPSAPPPIVIGLPRTELQLRGRAP
jgi:hypothetical protein